MRTTKCHTWARDCWQVYHYACGKKGFIAPVQTQIQEWIQGSIAIEVCIITCISQPFLRARALYIPKGIRREDWLCDQTLVAICASRCTWTRPSLRSLLLSSCPMIQFKNNSAPIVKCVRLWLPFLARMEADRPVLTCIWIQWHNKLICTGMNYLLGSMKLLCKMTQYKCIEHNVTWMPTTLEEEIYNLSTHVGLDGKRQLRKA